MNVLAKKLSESRVALAGYAPGSAVLARRRADAARANLEARAHVIINTHIDTASPRKMTVVTTVI